MDALYHDPRLVEVYDALNAARDDFEFYAQEMPKAPAALLDIGCGTGTFALELAGRGYAVTAVDPAPQMIKHAQQKDAERSVRWVTGLVSDLPRDLRVDAAVMTGHAFQCLLEDQQVSALFDGVANRLKAGGSFWFETRNRAAKPWLRWTPEHTSPPVQLREGRRVQVMHKVVEVTDTFVTFEEHYHFSDGGSPLLSRSTLRFLDLERIEELAVASGLTLSQPFGDWQRRPVKDDGPEIIVQVTKAA